MIAPFSAATSTPTPSTHVVYPPVDIQPPSSPSMQKENPLPPVTDPEIDPEVLAKAIQLVRQQQSVTNTINLPEGTYKGPLINGKPEGNGFLEYYLPDTLGRYTYQGTFVNGIPHGKGTMTWTNGRTYSGDWANGKWHGRGVYKWSEHEQYYGLFENGQFHGHGTYKSQRPGLEGSLIDYVDDGEFRDNCLWNGTRRTNSGYTQACTDGIFLYPYCCGCNANIPSNPLRP